MEIIISALIIIIVVSIAKYFERQKIVRRTTTNETAILSASGTLVGGDYPMLGSTKREVVLIVTKNEIIIADKQHNNSTKIPLNRVKAQVCDQSAVTAMKIFLFGIFAFGSKDKLLVFNIEDPSSGENYTSVFKDVPNREGFADIVNRLRYNLKISESKETIPESVITQATIKEEIVHIHNGSEYESDIIIDVTDNNFDTEVLGSIQPVLLYVHANWCAPCKLMEPVIDKISEVYSDQFKIVRLNADDCKETSIKIGIKSIPTILIYNKGKVVDQIVGYQTFENVIRRLNF